MEYLSPTTYADVYDDPLSSLKPLVASVKPYLGEGAIVENLHVIGTSFLLYTGLYEFSKRMLLTESITKQLKTEKSAIDFCMRVVSFFQATLICLLGIPIYENKHLKDRMFATTPYTNFYASMALGYFLWDTMMSLRYLKYFGIGFLIHGIVSTAIFTAGLSQGFIHYYTAVFLLFEASTPFLDIRWFGLKFGDKIPQWFQLANNLVLILVFFMARIAWGWVQAWTMAFEMFDVWDDPRFPQRGAIVILAGNMVLNVLNLYWFNKMITVAAVTVAGWLGANTDEAKRLLM